MPPRRTQSKSVEITETVHKDRRANIPTEELRDFITADEAKPKKMLYPRDPSLDPQLVWRGKDEQDAEPLAVPVVPIYIQEKIKPQAIIASLQKEVRDDDIQRNFYSDFNGGPKDFADKVDFYKFDQNWTNRFILGDSLMIMTSLAEKEGMKGKAQVVYLDPPYGIRFGSNWQVSTRKREVKDGKSEDASRQPEQVKAFRDTWELGVHSYLAYLRERLVVARELLTDTGSIFVQIGDENAHLVRSLLDEVFGSEQFIANIAFQTKIPLGTKYLPGLYDYILWYGKSKDVTKFRRLFTTKDSGADTQFGLLQLSDGSRRTLTADELDDPSNIPIGSRAFTSLDLSSSGRTESCVFPFTYNAKQYVPTAGKSWKTNEPGMAKLAIAHRLYSTQNALRYTLFHEDFPVKELGNVWSDTTGVTGKTYAVQTSPRAIERCILMSTDPGDLVIDPTCGSGTTAYVAEQWGRRWITCDTSRVALALARTRLMSARFPYYLLADSEDGLRKEAESPT